MSNPLSSLSKRKTKQVPHPNSVFRTTHLSPDNMAEHSTDLDADTPRNTELESMWLEWKPVPDYMDSPIDNPTNDKNFEVRFERICYSLKYLTSHLEHLRLKPSDHIYDITLYRYMCSAKHVKVYSYSLKSMKYLVENGIVDLLVSVWTNMLNITDPKQWAVTNPDHHETLYQLCMTVWFISSDEQLRLELGAKYASKLLDIATTGSFYTEMKGYKRSNDILKALLGCLYQYAQEPEIKAELVQQNATQKLITLKEKVKSHPNLNARCSFVLVYLMTETELKQGQWSYELITFLNAVLGSCMDSMNHRSNRYNFTAVEIFRCLNYIAASDLAKGGIYKKTNMNTVLKLMRDGSSEEQEEACKLLWHLSFDKTIADSLRTNHPDIDANLRELMKSPIEAIRVAAAGCLWVFEDLKKEKQISRTLKGGGHIMISYQWGVQKQVLQLKEKLQELGYRVWIDVEKMASNTLSSMSEAVENSRFVVIIFTDKYVKSPACRCEAEYAFKLQKEIIPIRMQPGYSPDGWLAIMFGLKPPIDLTSSEEDERSRVLNALVNEFGDKCRGDPIQTDGAELPVSNEVGVWNGDDTEREEQRQLVPALEPEMINEFLYRRRQHNKATTPYSAHARFTPQIVEPKCKKWSVEEVKSWAEEKTITDLISRFEGCEVDGQILAEMRVMQQIDFKFFCETSQQELQLTYFELLKLNSCLREL